MLTAAIYALHSLHRGPCEPDDVAGGNAWCRYNLDLNQLASGPNDLVHGDGPEHFLAPKAARRDFLMAATHHGSALKIRDRGVASSKPASDS